jgi:hypothetical protein
MSDTPETLAAILAEMRDFADHRAADAGGERPGIELLRSYADRIEAAAERERDEDRQLAAIAESDEAFARCARCDRPERVPGNAAALREALEKLADAVRNYFGWDDAPAVHDRDDPTAYFCSEMSAALAALAAPARNCDRFATAEEAVVAFADHLRAWENAHGIYSEYPNHPVKVPAGAFAWLYANAEGGDNA